MWKLFVASILGIGLVATSAGTWALTNAAAATITVQPGQSIQAAVNNAAAGDTILVQPGLYAAGVTIDKPLTLRSTERWGAILDGDADGDGEVTAAQGFRLASGASDVVIDGFEIRNVRSQGNSADGIEAYSGGTGSTFKNNWIHDVSRFNYTGSLGQDGISVRQNDVTIENNLIEDIGRTTPGDVARDHGIYANGGGTHSGLVIRDNYFEGIEHGWGIQLYPGAWTSFEITGNDFVGGNPSREYTHIILGANLTGTMDDNTFWSASPSQTMQAYSGSWNIDLTGNQTTGSTWTTGSIAGISLGEGNILNAQIPQPPRPGAGEPPPPPPPPDPQCADGVDNADPEDALIDLADPGCENAEDDDETDEPDEPPPPSPEPPVLSLEAQSSSRMTVTIRWTGITGATGYRLYRNGTAVSIASASARTARFGGLILSTQYTFGVQARGFSNAPIGTIRLGNSWRVVP